MPKREGLTAHIPALARVAGPPAFAATASQDLANTLRSADITRTWCG